MSTAVILAPVTTLPSAPPPDGGGVSNGNGRHEIGPIETIGRVGSRNAPRGRRDGPGAEEIRRGDKRLPGRALGVFDESSLRPRGGSHPAASAQFLVQAMGQALGPPPQPIIEHRDGASLGSEAYRRVGGLPPLYSEQPTVFRITI